MVCPTIKHSNLIIKPNYAGFSWLRLLNSYHPWWSSECVSCPVCPYGTLSLWGRQLPFNTFKSVVTCSFTIKVGFLNISCITIPQTCPHGLWKVPLLTLLNKPGSITGHNTLHTQNVVAPPTPQSSPPGGMKADLETSTHGMSFTVSWRSTFLNQFYVQEACPFGFLRSGFPASLSSYDSALMVCAVLSSTLFSSG